MFAGPINLRKAGTSTFHLCNQCCHLNRQRGVLAQRPSEMRFQKVLRNHFSTHFPMCVLQFFCMSHDCASQLILAYFSRCVARVPRRPH